MNSTQRFGLTAAAFAIAALAVTYQHAPRVAHGQNASTGLPGTVLQQVGAPTMVCSATSNANIQDLGFFADAVNFPTTGGYQVSYVCSNITGTWKWLAYAYSPQAASGIVGLATVGMTGKYTDLTGTPTIPAAVTTLPYTAITGTPTIPSIAGLVTATQAAAAAPVQSVNGATGAVVITPTVTYYGASGAMTGVKCYIGTFTSTTSGTFTQSISPAGITTLLWASGQIRPASATAANAYTVSILSTSTATTINGMVTAPATIVVGGLGVALTTTALSGQIEACGT